MAIIRWGSPEAEARGWRENEVLIFTSGSYSDYSLGRVVMTTHEVTANEIEAAAARTKLQDNGRPKDPEWRFLYINDLIDTLIADGHLREIAACEVHEESVFAKDNGPGLKMWLSEIEKGGTAPY